MKKDELIERRGEGAWERKLETNRVWYEKHKVQAKETQRIWRKRNPEKVAESKRVWYRQNREQTIERSNIRQNQHPEQSREYSRIWRKRNPEKVAEKRREVNRKGGIYYEKKLKDEQTGLRGERNKIRNIDARKYRPYKRIIAPESQIHHEWIPGTSNYTGVALVEKERHQHGIIDVIHILDGDITLLSEKEIRER